MCRHIGWLCFKAYQPLWVHFSISTDFVYTQLYNVRTVLY